MFHRQTHRHVNKCKWTHSEIEKPLARMIISFCLLQRIQLNLQALPLIAMDTQTHTHDASYTHYK